MSLERRAFLRAAGAALTRDAVFLNLPVPITEARRNGFAAYRGLRTE